MGALANLFVTIGARTTELDTSLNRAAGRIKSFGSSIQSAGQAMTYSFTAPMALASVGLLKLAGDMDALTRGLTAVTGSADKTNQQLQSLKEVAKMPGLGFREAVQGSINLQAAGFSAALAERSLKAFGNALATVGKGKAELDGVNIALTQIMSKGKVSAEEINQLQERLPQIRQAMKAAFGTADTEALQKMGIDSQRFIEAIVAQFEKLPPVVGGFKNDLENLRDKIEITGAEFGKSLIPMATAAMKALEPLIEKAKGLAEGFQKLPPTLQNAVVSVTALGAAIPVAVWGLGTLITNFGVVSQAVVKFSGFIGVSTLALAGWVGGIAAAVAALWTLESKIDDYYAAKEGRKNAEEGLEKQISKTAAALRAQGVDLSSLESRYTAGLITQGQYMAGLRQLAVEHGNLQRATAGTVAAQLSISDALRKFGLTSTEDLKKQYEAAKLTYQTIAKSGESAMVKAAALQKLKEAEEALYGVEVKREKVKPKDFGSLSAMNAVLVEEYRLQVQENENLAKSIAKTNLYHDEQLAKVGDVPAVYNDASNSIKHMGEVLGGLASVPDQLGQSLKEDRDALDRLGVSMTKATYTTQQANADYARAVQLYNQGIISKKALTDAEIANLKARQANDDLTPQEIEHLHKLEDANKRVATSGEKAWKTLGREIQSAMKTMSRGIADAIVEARSLGDAFLQCAKSIAKAILEIAIEQGVKKLIGALSGVLDHLGLVGKGLKEWAGIGSGVASTAARIGSGAASAAGSGIDVINGVESAWGGASKVAGGAASGAAGALGTIGSIANIAGAVGSIGSFITGIFSARQQEKDADVLNNHTLRIFNELSNFRADARARESHLIVKLDDIWGEIRNVVSAIKGGVPDSSRAVSGSVTININGISDPRAVAQAVAKELKLQGAFSF